MIELNQVIHGDCMEVMKDIPDKYFELAIVDPPYGIKQDKGFSGKEGFNGKGKPIQRRQYVSEWDSDIPNAIYFLELERVSVHQIIFGGNYMARDLPKGTHWLVWDKKNTMPTFSDCELLWTSFNRNSTKIIEIEYNGLLGKEKQPRFHPTQKPVALYKWLLTNYAKQGDKILDTHAGSCSSVIACIDYGFEYLAIEKDKEYFDKATERIEKHLLQYKLLA